MMDDYDYYTYQLRRLPRRHRDETKWSDVRTTNGITIHRTVRIWINDNGQMEYRMEFDEL